MVPTGHRGWASSDSGFCYSIAMWTDKRVRRRSRRASRTGAAVVVCTLILAACGQDREAAAPTSQAGAPASRAPAPGAPARNVLLVTIDTLRSDALGAYRPGLTTSPNIDRLAKEGVLFEQVTTSSPSTLPSHASLFTARHPYAHGARANSGYVLSNSQATLAEAFQAAGYITGAEVSTLVIARRKGLAQGFDHYRDPDSQDTQHKTVVVSGGGQTERRSLDERPAEDVTRHGIAFLRRHRGKPFFLWLHYFDPHAEYAAPLPFARRFPDEPYHAEVAYTDAALGRVIAALEDLGLAERTLVAVTSDHGEGLGEHDESTHSFLVYDTTMRVPLVLWGPPDLPRGRSVEALARTIDVAPTLLHWAGLPSLPGAQGQPLQELIEGEGGDGRTAYGESIEPRAAFGASVLRFVRRGPWKFIHKPNPELYDVRRDPEERNNRAAAEPERVTMLRDRLAAMLREPTVAPADSSVAMEPDEVARLAALGYATASGPAPPNAAGESLELRGADPNEALGDLRRLATAYSVLETERDYARAAALYADLGARHPEGLPILRGWIDSLRMLGRTRELLPLVERAVRLTPKDVALRMKLVEALEATGRLEDAERETRVALAATPCGELEIAYLSRVLRARGRFEVQRDELLRAVKNCDSDGVRNEYAYFLATCPVDVLRNGEEALGVARWIVERPGNARPEFLDTLAAAHAELGDFAEATRIQRDVVANLEGRGVPETSLAEFRDHLRAFEAGHAVREPPSTEAAAPWVTPP